MKLESTDELLPIYSLTDDLVLFVHKGVDLKKEGVKKVVQINFFDRTFYIDILEKFLKFTPFEEIDFKNKELVGYYQGLLNLKLQDEIIFKILEEYDSE